ncbi:MAG: histidine kinase [Burkholderiales bacterium]|nr:histidine kinase [Burkholderiales bacterium]
MASINQNGIAISLPNFCNLGSLLRSLLIVNAIGLIVALARAQDIKALWPEFLAVAAFLEPGLLLTVVLLCGARRLVAQLSYRAGLAAVLLIVLVIVTLIYKAGESMLGGELGYSLLHVWILALLIAGTLLFYFDLRARALSPALAEARLQALQARIRPHFLFNSLNAVLSLIRSQPKRAEQALQDMAELFRVLMADNRQLITLQREVELCRQYLDIEQLRLGERLQVVWHVDKMPNDALIPPLVLQPLLENAVYHGVEPSNLTGEITINIYTHRRQVVIVLRNPYHAETSHHSGNKMAMSNIRERLSLHFDAEANLKSQILVDAYQVTITLPYVTESAAA